MLSFRSGWPARAAACALLLALGARAAEAQTPVRLTMDWAFQGPQAPFLVALEKGYYADEGLEVTIDRGYGSGDVPVKLASGTYDVGFADINPMIKMKAEAPSTDLVAVALLYDSSPLAAMTIKATGIAGPGDLEGKTIAAPEFDAGRQLFPAFVQATGIDASGIEWLTVTPQLRETMMARQETDAITGFDYSGIFSLMEAGVPREDIVVMRYSDHGVDLYSGALITTKTFAEANPAALKGLINATVKGYRDTIADPAAAIETLVARDPLLDPEIEQERLQLAIDALILSDHVRSEGVSAVDPDRMQKAIDQVRMAYGIEAALAVEDVYTDAYLPPFDQLKLVE
ncbi:ABC transporter substrate-binding protein [Marinivivus vitaminiproducens]|uniref:ABC transporter substrate-binding protein n=1 Tax=Marinivivus vitaminiproducens TaxID=3035935 RepID=UPI0027A27806|nr:ABC transporter substrate-binding protein [Geminicoccaceae bacterium SCSIO 64248]